MTFAFISMNLVNDFIFDLIQLKKNDNNKTSVNNT